MPPLVHFQTPHPSIAWDYINLAVPTQPTELKVTNGPVTVRDYSRDIIFTLAAQAALYHYTRCLTTHTVL